MVHEVTLESVDAFRRSPSCRHYNRWVWSKIDAWVGLCFPSLSVVFSPLVVDPLVHRTIGNLLRSMVVLGSQNCRIIVGSLDLQIQG
jgi:hypothetical protein